MEKKLSGDWGQSRGRKAHRRRLTDEDVRTIRWTAANMPGTDLQAKADAIAKHYSVTGSTIADVIRGHSFATVTGLPVAARRWHSPSHGHDWLLAWMIWWLVLTQFKGMLKEPLSPITQEAIR